jgi:hypothetical protein
VIGIITIHSPVLVPIIWRFAHYLSLDQALPLRDPLQFSDRTGTPVTIRNAVGQVSEHNPAAPVGRGTRDRRRNWLLWPREFQGVIRRSVLYLLSNFLIYNKVISYQPKQKQSAQLQLRGSFPDMMWKWSA